LYSNFDLKKIFIASIVIFEAGSAVCGAAPNMDTLIVGRAIAGLGGSGIFLGTLNFFSLTTTHQERGNYIAGVGAGM
jgi:MFS family permease